MINKHDWLDKSVLKQILFSLILLDYRIMISFPINPSGLNTGCGAYLPFCFFFVYLLSFCFWLGD